MDGLDLDPGARRERIVRTLDEAFGPLVARDPAAISKKYRKMARDPFAFYRGTACLFYADVSELPERWVDERTRRVWIQGDLHAENYGTYMNAAGILVFDVNDFDEAYVAPYTWDLMRMAASLALLGYGKALSDAAITAMVDAYARAYLDQVRRFAAEGNDGEFRLTLESTDGAVHAVLGEARRQTQFGLLERDTAVENDDRRFTDGPGVRRLDDAERAQLEQAYAEYLETIPARKRQQSISYKVKDVVGRSGFGIGSAGLPAYNLLVEGPSQALEDDVILSMKQGNVAAPSRVIDDPGIREAFDHHGHRTAVSQRALQAHADPWLGWCQIDGTGFVVKELSPYEADLDWGALSEPDEILPLLGDLGRATAKVHCVGDADAEHDIVSFSVEDAIAEVVDDDDAFVADLARFAAGYGALARDDHREFVDAFRNGEFPGLEAV